MKLYVKTKDYVYEVRSPEPYGGWHEDHNFSIEGVCLEKPDYGYEVFEVAFEPKEDDTVYVLYMIYNTGDSFGSSDGNGEVLWVFPNGRTAIKAQRAIEKNIQNYSIAFSDGFGNITQMSNPAAGYFEELQEIDVKEFLVKERI